MLLNIDMFYTVHDIGINIINTAPQEGKQVADLYCALLTFYMIDGRVCAGDITACGWNSWSSVRMERGM